MKWSDVQKKDPIYLNLGGGINCHPKIEYENYISVDINPPYEGLSVKHDVREPIPLVENSVTRILSEDLMEHLKIAEIKTLLRECFRLLKPRGAMRIGVPDYNNPKDHLYFKKGRDPRHHDHITLTNYELMKNIIEKSPFLRYEFYHYWDKGEFIYKKIDYSFGMIKRTPDNDPRCRLGSFKQKAEVILADFLFKLTRGFRVSEEEMSVRRGHRLYVTSLVVDLFKD
ncbi:MAG: methyltransferase domain-containing protein [Candidatus Aminicenantes bacterium]|nr:methyltransferase domain-containing protein [Candidatus Aminicenantes bacterium]